MITAYDPQAIAHTEALEVENRMLLTTVGRVILFDSMPKGMPFINGLLKKKGLGQLVSYIYLRHGPEMTITMLDRHQRAGISVRDEGGNLHRY